MLTNVIDRFGFIPEPIEVRAGGYVIRPMPNHADLSEGGSHVVVPYNNDMRLRFGP